MGAIHPQALADLVRGALQLGQRGHVRTHRLHTNARTRKPVRGDGQTPAVVQQLAIHARVLGKAA